MIDAANSKAWGWAAIERLFCKECSYVSPYYKLYEEVETDKRGRKAAQINVGIQLGLLTTPLSNTGLSRMLTNTNIPPPNLTSLQKMATHVSTSVTELNEQSMSQIRQQIKADNKLCGLSDPSLVNTEGDSCYNNLLFSCDSTPFQGALLLSLLCVTTTQDQNLSLGSMWPVSYVLWQADLKTKASMLNAQIMLATVQLQSKSQTPLAMRQGGMRLSPGK
jgi:hypothetical protein